MRFSLYRSAMIAVCSSLSLAAIGCGGEEPPPEPEPTAFTLAFMAAASGAEVGCTDTITGVGPAGKHAIGLSDLRFYVSNLVLKDADGNAVEVTLDKNDFQYQSAQGSVALIDFTSNTDGTCKDTSVAFAEGTARTNTSVTGKTLVDKVASISFDVGVPQAVMKDVIANQTAEGAPSPLNEMYWSWASGYRHFVMNFTVDDGEGGAGEGYVHIGSRDCGPADGKALEDRDTCDFVNTPTVSLSGFDLASNVVMVDLTKVVTSLDFVSPIYDMMTFEVIGEGPGVECHSSPMQPDCAPILGNFGIDASTGAALAAQNGVFSVK